ncbi:putative protein FAM111A-like [Scophthalmus maximus]|uniref:Uncharacterized protein n=1 Tax=Scophthalmus maximus TaxID=52904 RepID=A0A2U9B7P2_SCOMX|nr:putative protein FAM111A-like [Scophthalmus maximus]
MEQKSEQIDKTVEGGKDIVKMMRNPELRKFVDTMTVYAYKVTEGNTEMSNLVDHLDGTTYKIILLNRCLPESQQSSLEDDNIISNASQGFDHDDNQNPSQQPTTTVSVNDAPERKTKPAPELFFREMPESEKLKHNLSSQFTHLMKGKESVARLSLEDLNKENIGLYVHKLTVHFSFESLDQCRVVAMHSAGYKYPGARGETRSVIEFGYRLSDIMERIIIQLVERRRWDVLKAYLACSFEHQQNVMINTEDPAPMDTE